MSDENLPIPPAPPPAPPPRTDGVLLSLLLAVLVVVGGAAWLFDRRLRSLEERLGPREAASGSPSPRGDGAPSAGGEAPRRAGGEREATLQSLSEALQQLNDDTYQYYVDSSQDLHELKRLVRQVQSVVRSMRPASPGFAYGSWGLPELGRRPTAEVLAKIRADAEAFGIRVEDGRVEVPGFLNLSPNRAMPIEYFVSRWPVLGHETLVHVNGNVRLQDLSEERLQGLPTAVYKALVAAGFQQGEGSRMEEGPDGKGVWVPPSGDRVYLGFRYKVGDATHLARATDWVVDPSTGTVLPEDGLRFTGSRRMEDPETGDEELSAEVSGLVVSVYYNPSTLVEIAVPSNVKNMYEYNYARIPRHQGEEPLLLDVVFSRTPIVPEGDGAKPIEKPVVVPPEGVDPGMKPEGEAPTRDPAGEKADR